MDKQFVDNGRYLTKLPQISIQIPPNCLSGGGEADDERALGGGGRQDQVPDAPLERREGRRQAGGQRRLRRVRAQAARPDAGRQDAHPQPRAKVAKERQRRSVVVGQEHGKTKIDHIIFLFIKSVI